MEEDDIKVKQWSFCPECKGRGVGCKTCNGTGKLFELVLLNSFPKLLRKEYETAQADFIQKQLEGH